VGELEGAAESFGKAADHYKLVAEKYPQLTENARDHVHYLEAWREIEAAKNSHQQETYQDASNRYDKASKILSETQKWSFLSKYYNACRLIEEAEAFSIEDEYEKALELFNKASGLLQDELESQKRPSTGASALEAEALQDWLFSARVKQKLSSARAILEEARISMKNGRNAESARCYGKAASKFEELVSDVAEEHARSELRTTSLLCKAWQKMREGEIEVSPARYSEAATLFFEAKDSTKKQRLGLLALGNGALCKALEHSTEFQLKRDNALYASTKQQFELAARYYVEAGFKRRSDYVTAYTRFFDALTYVSRAEEELDPAKRKEHYILAERHLQQAVKLFEQGGFAAKKDEVLRHLERVEQGKQLLLTTSEMLSGAAMISSSADVSAPIIARDQPIGLVESESANVQGRINVNPNTLNVGDPAELSIQLINVGRRPAFLLKTERIVPDDFEIKEKPESYRVEDGHLDMKGKRLDPLKTEEIRLVLKALSKGTFSMNPKFFYLDETGKHKSHEPESVTITVKELGIKGWLKGER
jgi:tetratricopeptide (TPR) repeat protein